MLQAHSRTWKRKHAWGQLRTDENIHSRWSLSSGPFDLGMGHIFLIRTMKRQGYEQRVNNSIVNI